MKHASLPSAAAPTSRSRFPRFAPAAAPRIARRVARLAVLAVLAVLALAGSGCGAHEADVVLYCAVDQAHAEPIIAAFEKSTGLDVEAYYDVEASKSVGLRRRLQAESVAGRPICDVFWNNEPVQTVVLARQGMLQPYDSPSAADIPARYRDPARMWTGFAARARVLIVNTAKLPDPASRPSRTADLADPSYRGRTGMAEPLTGTTAAHAAWWLATLGHDGTFALFERLRANQVRFGPGNAHLMRLVREGELDFGFTDTDDCQEAIDEGFPVQRVLPDQGAGDPGLLVIPNTVALVKGAPHADNGRKLIDHLLSREVEARLAAGPSVQIPLRDDVARPASVVDLRQCKLADTDWAAAGAAYEASADELEAYFTR
ncbi:MAG TPA: extracellular solute-binding protein [Planctomycetota bacterium]|nr:extracellular solute-binding protein [Planctomycetota bacterium]